MIPVKVLVYSHYGVAAHGSRTTAPKNEWMSFDNHQSEDCSSNLNIRPDSLNPIEESVHYTLQLIDMGKGFLNRTLVAWSLRPITNQ